MHSFDELNDWSEKNGKGFKLSKKSEGWSVFILGSPWKTILRPTLSQAVREAIRDQERGSKLPSAGKLGNIGPEGDSHDRVSGTSALLDDPSSR